MAFVVPNFNLSCNLWSAVAGVPVGPSPAGAPREEDLECALVYGHRINGASTGGTGSVGIPMQAMHLLLPPGADVRGLECVSGQDTAEVPSDSGRWYLVFWVDDVGKGWGNEHRTALLLAVEGSWSPPYP